MGPAEWDALSWDLQRTYLDGLEQDEEVPFAFKEADPFESGSPRIRENVDAGTDVIDLTKMRQELEAARGR